MRTACSLARTRLANIDSPIMQRLERRSVTDRNDRRAWQALSQQSVDYMLGGFVERSCGLIKKQPVRLEENASNHHQALLFAERQLVLPMGLLIEAVRQPRK